MIYFTAASRLKWLLYDWFCLKSGFSIPLFYCILILPGTLEDRTRLTPCTSPALPTELTAWRPATRPATAGRHISTTWLPSADWGMSPMLSVQQQQPPRSQKPFWVCKNRAGTPGNATITPRTIGVTHKPIARGAGGRIFVRWIVKITAILKAPRTLVATRCCMKIEPSVRRLLLSFRGE